MNPTYRAKQFTADCLFSHVNLSKCTVKDGNEFANGNTTHSIGNWVIVSKMLLLNSVSTTTEIMRFQ